VDADRGSGWAEKLAVSAHASVHKVELAVRAGQREHALARTSGCDHREVNVVALALLVEFQDGVEAREVQKADLVDVDHEESDAAELDPVQSGRQLMHAREVDVSLRSHHRGGCELLDGHCSSRYGDFQCLLLRSRRI
jgi:hypothetical protein